MLAYITPEEGGILQLLGGSGAPGPMGIPSFYESAEESEGTDAAGDPSAGTDGPSGEADGGASSSGNANDPSQGGTESPSVGGGPSYSDTTISDAMAASSPTGMSGVGGIGGYGPSVAGSTSMGLEDSIASMAAAMGGHTRGLTGYQNVQGAVDYSPVGKIDYDIFGLRNKMNKHARDSLSRGVQPSFSIDSKGNVTSVTGPGGPASGIPGIGSLMSMIGTNMGFSTTTGYAGKGVDDTDIGGNENDDQDIVKDARTFLGEDIAEIEDDKDDKVVGKSFMDPELYRYLQGRRAAPSVVVGGYGQDIVGASSAKPVDFSAIDRGLQKTQSGIQAINRYR